MWIGVPVVQLADDETSRLLNMEDVLHERIIGQDEAIIAISKAIRRARAGLKDPRRPIGNFIFLGPTGVGKTELARTLAEFMFGSEDALIRIDMSEFMEKFAVSRLVGAPPGYVGYDEGGQLTEAVRRKPYCCILLDEIEKAHEDVFNILLQIFDDGHLTDAKGRRVDFRNSIIIMTSNIGAELIKKGFTIGFTSHTDEAKTREKSYEKMKENLLDQLKNRFKPEFLNRIDDQVVFRSLTKEQIRSIVNLMLVNVTQQLREKEIKIEVTEAAKDHLGEKGYNEEYGARPLRRVIQDLIEDRLSESVLRDEFKVFDRIYETKTRIKKPEAMAGIIAGIKEIEGMLHAEESGENITVYSKGSIKFDIEKLTKDRIKEALKDQYEEKSRDKELTEPKVTESTYVSYVVVDIKDGEITVDSLSSFALPDMAVGAAK
jgi:ATP-dependent Clp protease ATP-binding subunit ClpC